MEWMFVPFKRYADFSGRSRRMEYWMYQLFTMAVYVILFAIVLAGFPWNEMMRSSASYNPEAVPGPLTWIGFGLIMLWYLVTFIPDIAVTVRRLHDQDQSGWLYLLRFIPYIGALVIFVFMLLDGQRQENRFGPDPKNEGFDAGVFS